ncbi:MAG: C2 family cysteine protease [Thermoguttaceae bacterium]
MALRRALSAIGMALTLLGVARADSPTPFTTIVRAHWKEWAGASGAITPEQLDRLMKKRKIHGEAAAVLAAMKRREKDPKTKQPITWTIERIEEYESLVAQHHRQNTYDKDYEKSLALIKADPHTLYVDGAPHLSSIRQARSGDCWLLATIGALIHRNRHELRSLIADEGDHLYAVHFAYHMLTVKAPTDAEIGAYTSDKSDGDWLYVLENATGQYREHYNHLHKVSEANDDALIGGNGALALRDILGRNSDHVGMTPKKPQRDLVRKTLTRAFKERRLVILGTTGDKTITLPNGISHGHCMALIGWDAAADKVTIWNPWGNTFEPKGTGPNAGYKTLSGVFTMPLADFTRSFAGIDVENSKPYKPKK